MRLRLPRWLISLTLAVGALSTLTASDGIREDELRCEEAKKHLSDCCGSQFDFSYIDCHYDPGGCGVGPTPPSLDVGQSVCLRDASCDVLQQFACDSPEQFSCQ